MNSQLNGITQLRDIVPDIPHDAVNREEDSCREREFATVHLDSAKCWIFAELFN